MSQEIPVTVTERDGREYASTGSTWEPIIGYSRAVKAGAHIAVTGCVGIEADGTFSTEIGQQARRAIQIVLAAVEALGGTAGDVVRTRMFVTDISKWKDVGEAHGEFFGEIRPATTIVEVARLIDGQAMIEVEADAILTIGQRTF